VQVYRDWLASNNVGLVRTRRKKAESKRGRKRGTPKPNSGQKFNHLFRLYALGDMLQDVTFCNGVIDEVIWLEDWLHELPGPQSIKLLCEIVPSSLKLMTAVVDSWATWGESDYLQKYGDKFPTEFVHAVAVVAMSDRNMSWEGKQPTHRPKCYYHEHKEDAGKCQ
jgi:hypothetical protein